MIEKDVHKEFDKVMADICTPGLKSLGFKKSGTNFYRQTEELIQTFNFQKSPFNNRRELSFTGNIGFIEPETHLKLYQLGSLPKFPKCTDSIIQCRLGLITNLTDYWYKITTNSDVVHVAKKLKTDMQKVQEFFERHKNSFFA